MSPLFQKKIVLVLFQLNNLKFKILKPCTWLHEACDAAKHSFGMSRLSNKQNLLSFMIQNPSNCNGTNWRILLLVLARFATLTDTTGIRFPHRTSAVLAE